MNFSLLKKIIHEIKDKGVQTSYLHQIGEPLSHPQIIDMINLVASVGVRTSISTNGILLYQKKDELLNSELSEITLCLDGITKKTYEYYRRPAHFQTILKNIFDFLSDWSLRKSKIHVQIQFIIMEKNVSEIKKLTEAFSVFKNRGSFEVLTKPYSTFAGRVDDLGGKSPSRKAFCQKPFREMTINWDGTVVLCCRDFDHFSVIGDTNKNSIQEIWLGPKMENYRVLFRQGLQGKIPLCKNC